MARYAAHCGVVDEAHSAGRAHDLRCNACNGKFRLTHGTPFEGTHLPLQNVVHGPL
jgi:hypothetical protein